MFLVAAEFSLAERIGSLLSREPAYTFSLVTALEEAERRQPAIIFLDVRLGGSTERAVEWIPRLLGWSPASAIILITRAPTNAEIAEAVAFGAYHYLDRLDCGFVVQLAKVVSAALASATRREERLPSRRRLA